MKKHLSIDLNTLPEEGKTFSGELDTSIFNDETRKSKGEPQAVEPLFYDLYAQRFDQELLLRGSISVNIEFTCVRCLNKYTKFIEIDECAVSHEITSSQVDFASELREEVVILYPDYPSCDHASEEQECILDSRYLAVDKSTSVDVKTPSPDEAPNPWEALDAFGEDAENNS